MINKMKTIHYHRLLKPLFVLMAMLMAACSSDTATDEKEPLPEGMGRIRITICTPENNPDLTRAVGDPAWEAPDHEWERLQTFRILICDASDKVVEIISGDKTAMTAVTGTSYPYKQSAELTSGPLPVGSYHIYATANYADGYTVGSTVDPDRIVKLPAFNGYSETNIPMSGKLASPVTVTGGIETPAGTITVWRMVSKLQFEFTNESTRKIQIKGIEIQPINQMSATDGGIYFFSKDDLTSTANLAAGTGITLPTAAKTDVGTVVYTPATALTLDENGGTAPTGNLFFYVNETDATFTTTENQFSVRFKIARQNGGSWFADEIRYGLTTNHNGTSGGFNVIRRNDWIHIPIHLTDWEFRIEATPFVPIAGYPAMLLSSDALTAKFSTGGYIILKPFAQKNKDGSWRDFSDPEVTYVSVTWTNSDGTDVSGGDKIVKTPFTYDSANYCLTGELNNDLGSGTYKTTITVNLKLGPTGDQYDYSFSCNVILQK